MDVVVILAVALGLVAIVCAVSARVVKQYERGWSSGSAGTARDPRPRADPDNPGRDRLRKVNMQIVTMPVPAQDGITGTTSRCKVDAVIYFKVADPQLAIVNVQDYRFAVGQVAQTSLRSIIGKSELDDLLSNREKLNQGLELMIDSPALDWGVHIDRVEIKDVALPDSMKRSMSRQAEAERERRARVITADGELQAATSLRRRPAPWPTRPRAATAAVADHCGGRGREELDAGPPVPRRAAAVPGEVLHRSEALDRRPRRETVSGVSAAARTFSSRSVAAGSRLTRQPSRCGRFRLTLRHQVWSWSWHRRSG